MAVQSAAMCQRARALADEELGLRLGGSCSPAESTRWRRAGFGSPASATSDTPAGGAGSATPRLRLGRVARHALTAARRFFSAEDSFAGLVRSRPVLSRAQRLTEEYDSPAESRDRPSATTRRFQL